MTEEMLSDLSRKLTGDYAHAIGRVVSLCDTEEERAKLFGEAILVALTGAAMHAVQRAGGDRRNPQQIHLTVAMLTRRYADAYARSSECESS